MVNIELFWRRNRFQQVLLDYEEIKLRDWGCFLTKLKKYILKKKKLIHPSLFCVPKGRKN